eukprot:m.214514 g.214514  ORF g.214514 m.214514 type:complete len:56 (+) comp18620_c0_seq12:148-315(+)
MASGWVLVQGPSADVEDMPDERLLVLVARQSARHQGWPQRPCFDVCSARCARLLL